MLFISCVCQAFASVHCCLLVTQREMADLLALVCGGYCDFVISHFGILERVRYLIVSIPDPYCLSYLELGTIFMRFGLSTGHHKGNEPHH